MDQSQQQQPQQPQQRTSHQKLQEGIIAPHEHDVLSGRGNFVNYHAGNEHFRALVRKHKVAYVACPKPQKGQFSRMIYGEIKARDPPGRFLKQDSKTKTWYEIGEKQALAKTRQALREGAPELLKELSRDGSEDEDDDEGLGGTPVDNGDSLYSPNISYGPPLVVSPYGSNSPQVMPLKTQFPSHHHSPQQQVAHHSPLPPSHHSPPPPSSRHSPPPPSRHTPPPPPSHHSPLPPSHHSPLPPSHHSPPPPSHHSPPPPPSHHSTPRQSNSQLSNSQMAAHHMAMHNATNPSSSLQQLPSSQPLSMRAAMGQSNQSAMYPPQAVVSDTSLLHLQNKMAAMYQGTTLDSFEPTPIDPNLHRQQRYDPYNAERLVDHRSEKDFSPPPQRDMQMNGRSVFPRERTIHRDESLRIDKIFAQAANDAAATSAKSGKRMMGSSEHLSAMSFSIGDLSADAESNLSAVFEDSMRISGDQVQPMKDHKHDHHKSTGLNMDMSFATLGDRNESTSHFVMSTTTFESFTGVFEESDKKE